MGASATLIPAVMALVTLLALFSWHDAYEGSANGSLSFRVIDASPEVTPSAAAGALAGLEPRTEFQTHAQTPFWIGFSIPVGTVEPITVELRDRHIMDLSCWDSASGHLLGQVLKDRADGILHRAKAGLSVSPGALRAPLAMVCQVQFQGPAHLTVAQWNDGAFKASVKRFHRDSGLLDGGLGVLAVFVLVTALINRQSLYVIFAAWLVANLRMAAISAGWDFDWLGGSVPWNWLVPMRMWSAAIYYVVTIALFGGLFQEDLKRVGWPLLWHLLQLSCLIIVGACATLSFSQWLPVLWLASGFAVAVLGAFLGRILLITRSRVAMWYGLSLAVTLIATLNEIIAAAFGMRSLIGHVNSVTAAIFSSLIAALAIAEQMRQEHRARIDAQLQLHNAYDSSPVGLFTLSLDGRFIRANPAMRNVLQVQSLIHSNWSDHFGNQAWENFERCLNAAGHELAMSQPFGGQKRWVLVRAHLAGNHIEGSLQDVTERAAAAEHMRFLANHDPLTGVLNRRGIEHILETVSRGSGQQLSLGYLDLDRFKLLNDLYGHTTGDRILRQVCARVSALLQSGESLGRVGGDEFVILFADAGHDDAERRCQDIVSAISSTPYAIEERAAQVRCSIGLLHLTDDIALQDAISLADRACREAKAARNGLVVYRSGSTALHERADELRLIQLFNTNSVPAGLFLVMQPIMSLSAPDQFLDFEVLLRMREDDGSVTSAAPVVAAAESSGRIAVVDRWVLTSVLEWIGAHQSRLTRTRFVCVNLSGGSLNDENFVRDVYALLARSGEAAKQLCLEITETVALQDLDVTRRFIEQTRQYGVKIALDDFGAGYTSFSYLRELPADAVKIDGAFIRGMMRHPANLAIVTAIIELAHNLGMRTIAEWVEDVETLEGLVAAGADYAQGYAIGKPSDPSRILLADSAADMIEDKLTAAYVVSTLCASPTAAGVPSSKTGALLH